MNKDSFGCFERYRLILKHEYVSNDGKVIQADQPLVADHVVSCHDYTPAAIVDRMIAELGHEMLQRISR